MKVLAELPENTNNRKIALIIRHANRDGEKDLLTDQGKSKAFAYGDSLVKHNLNAIYTSPTDRCVETAWQIAEGYGKDIPVILYNILNETGIYVTDIDKAVETYKALGPAEYYKRLVAGEKLEGYRPFKEGSQKLEKFIRQTASENGLTLYITHNFIIRLFNHYINNFDHTVKFMKVDYLHGLILEL